MIVENGMGAVDVLKTAKCMIRTGLLFQGTLQTNEGSHR